MVLPRPTSSAMSRLTRAMSMARTSGSSWKSSMLTPLRNGAWRNPRSALVAAPHGIEEGVEHARIVLPRDGWQARALDDLSARLDLPDDFQFFAETVLVDR